MIIWRSVQRARKEHFCDCCGQYIWPGDLYERRARAIRGIGIWVWKEHLNPVCIDLEWEAELERERQEAIVALGVPIVFAAEIRQVLKVGVNGETIVEPETHFTPKFVCEAAPSERSDSDRDDEILF